MTLDTSFDLFGVGFESDPVTGIQINTGDAEVGVGPTGNTSVNISGGEVVGVPVELDLTQGALIGVGEEILFADLTEGVAIGAETLAASDIVLPTALDI